VRNKNSHLLAVFLCHFLVFKKKICYDEGMEENTQTNSPTTIERHNAVISYCFLAPFMLISRDERFNNHFVKIHARYALLIQIAFLVLITIFIRSRNFSSMIIFGASWVHILLFLCFFVLL
jgi:hypothetical protein